MKTLFLAAAVLAVACFSSSAMAQCCTPASETLVIAANEAPAADAQASADESPAAAEEANAQPQASAEAQAAADAAATEPAAGDSAQDANDDFND